VLDTNALIAIASDVTRAGAPRGHPAFSEKKVAGREKESEISFFYNHRLSWRKRKPMASKISEEFGCRPDTLRERLVNALQRRYRKQVASAELVKIDRDAKVEIGLRERELDGSDALLESSVPILASMKAFWMLTRSAASSRPIRRAARRASRCGRCRWSPPR